MQHTKITITGEELNIIENTDFLITKAKVLHKIKLLLLQLQDEIAVDIENYKLPAEVFDLHGKVSSGENYKGLPFLVLDYPRLFTIEDKFAYRSMFWWGHYFLFTLHLQGSFLKKFQKSIAENLKTTAYPGLYICYSGDQWQHDTEGYVKFNEKIEIPENMEFLKLACKLPLKKWQMIPDFGISTFKKFMHLSGTNDMP